MAADQSPYGSRPQITVDGAPLSPDVAPALARVVVHAHVHLPGMFALHFQDTDRTVLSRAPDQVRQQGHRGGERDRDRRADRAAGRRGHRARAGVGHHRDLDRGARLRPAAPPLPRSPDPDVLRRHRRRHRAPDRRGQPARPRRRGSRRAGVRPRQPGQPDRLGVPARPGARDRPRARGSARQAATGACRRAAARPRPAATTWLRPPSPTSCCWAATCSGSGPG